jgi:S1-C subfamily serine protease
MVEQGLGETAEGQPKPRWKWVSHLRRSREKCRWHKEMKRYIAVLLLLLSVLLIPCPFSVGGKIYKWVDEKGVVHFSDRAPESTDQIKGGIQERDLMEPSPGSGEAVSSSKLSARTPIAHAVNCTFTIKGASKVGTGFLISPNGYAVTCKHVVEEPSSYSALLNDKTEFPMTVISVSPRQDLAVVQVPVPQKGAYLSLRDAATLSPGERLFAIGASAGLQATVTDGVFTGIRRMPETEEEVIQFSAPVNPGNSGGPLVDEKGQVVGVVSMRFDSLKGVPINGVGFAVPSSRLLEEYGHLIAK